LLTRLRISAAPTNPSEKCCFQIQRWK